MKEFQPEKPVNRFHIDIRSDVLVGDMEWANVLLIVNLKLHQMGMPYVEAHLEEYEKPKK